MLKPKASSQDFIDTEVQLDNMEPWRLTCYYDFTGHSRQKKSWNLLRNLAAQSSLSWVILGDFNDILRESEKRGRNRQPGWMINFFRVTMFGCGVSDLSLEGYPFT